MTTHAKSNRKHISDLHFENKVHFNQLVFYRQELELLKNRLEELAARNTKTEVAARIEQFQNQFIRQQEVNDELRHKINSHQEKLVNYAKENPVAIDRVLFDDNDGLADEVIRYGELYKEMKDAFYRFAAEWL
ncbi:hypothetical protein QQ054_05410 [Oscillatoria amoena NRMC-F 0135]|nr:hypothetical protein [Oscillatoria amoena NRMC-F 0135]